MKDIKDRKTLKGYFKKGNIPTEEQFAALIDSVPNLAEDGQAVRDADGWPFYPEAGRPLQIRLHEAEKAPAAWTLCLTPENGLAVRNAQGETVAEIGQDGHIVLPDKEESGKKDGTEPVPGEKTEEEYAVLAADKQWHDLVTVTDRVFRMYDVFLLLHDPDTGAGKVTRAAALCLNSVDCRIESKRKHWWGWSGGVRLRWQERDGKPCLQVRSKRYRTSGKIFCKLR